MLGIFLEPQGRLRTFIVKWKTRIKKNYIDTKYIDHPPHSTIYLASLSNKKRVIEEIQDLVNQFKPFKIKIDKTDIFLNDKFTGKDTIYLSIKKNKIIFKFQKKLAEKLKYFTKKKKTKSFKYSDKKLKNSLLKYGFQFVGSHWRPHFTIGSIKNFNRKKDYPRFMKTKIYFENDVKKISLWKINKDKHKKIKEFKFSK